jgi:hypothetical protein
MCFINVFWTSQTAFRAKNEVIFEESSKKRDKNDETLVDYL